MVRYYQYAKQKQLGNSLNYSALRGVTLLNLFRPSVARRKRRFLVASFITLSGASAYSALTHNSSAHSAQPGQQTSSVGIQAPLAQQITAPQYMAIASLFVGGLVAVLRKQLSHLSQLKAFSINNLLVLNIRGSP